MFDGRRRPPWAMKRDAASRTRSSSLASQRRHGVVLRIAQQPLEDRVPQPDKPVLVVGDEPGASDPHRSPSRPRLAVSGRMEVSHGLGWTAQRCNGAFFGRVAGTFWPHAAPFSCCPVRCKSFDDPQHPPRTDTVAPAHPPRHRSPGGAGMTFTELFTLGFMQRALIAARLILGSCF